LIAANTIITKTKGIDLIRTLEGTPGFTTAYNPNQPILYLYQFLVSEKIGGITVWDLGVYLDAFYELLADLAAFKWLVMRAIRNELVADADSDKPIMLHRDFFRMTPGPRTLYPLIDWLRDIDGQDLLLALDKTLTAGPLMDLDTTYIVRGFLIEKCDEQLIWGFTVQSMIDDDITSVELSIPLHKIPHPDASSVVTGGVNIFLDYKWNENGICQRMYDFFHSTQVSQFLNIKWLPMYLGAILAEVDATGNTLRQTVDGRKGDNSTFGTYNPMADAVVEQLLQLDIVSGIDYAGQANFCIIPEGMGTGYTLFETQARMLLKVAVANGKRLVMHVHMGEGFGLFNHTAIHGDTYADPYTTKVPAPPTKAQGWGTTQEKQQKLFAAAVKEPSPYSISY